MWECQLGPERSHLLLDRSHRSPHGARALLIALALLCQLDLEDLFDRARFYLRSLLMNSQSWGTAFKIQAGKQRNRCGYAPSLSTRVRENNRVVVDGKRQALT